MQVDADDAPGGEDDDRVEQGRRIFFLGAVPLLLINLVAAWMRFSTTGNPVGFFRLCLAAALLWAVFRGHRWARVLLTGLLAIGAVLALLGAAGASDDALRLILVGISGIDAAFAGALMLSDPLRAFLTRPKS